MGPVALVTSGNSDLGIEIVRELHKAGARVAIGERPRSGSTRTVAPEAVSVHEGFLNDAGDCERTISEVVAEHGRLDCLVVVASRQGFGVHVPVAQSGADEWDRTIARFLSGPYYLMTAALRQMLEQGAGRIVVVVSSDGGPGSTGQAPQGVAAAGLVTLVQRTAREVAGQGVTVNVIKVGLVASASVGDEISRDLTGQLARAVPAGRLADPTEVARAVGFLCAPEAGYVTGQVLAIDGGFSI